MDQLKTFLNTAVKHIFWVICGIVVVLSVGSWYMARSQLQDDFRKNLATIDKSYSTVKQIRDKSNHPNESSEKEMERLNKGLLDSVLNAWGLQYSQQTNLLRWPAELGEDFVSSVRSLVPIELKVDYDPAKNPPTPLAQELDVTYKQLYANYVERLLPRLAEMIGAKWGARAPTGEMGFGMGEAVAPTTSEAPPVVPGEKPPVVWWSTADQGRLLGTHFNWAKQPDSAPTTLQLLYAQEDLWVLQALMSIIHDTNRDAESRHEAVVKSIDSLLIGAQASGRAGQVMRFRGAGFGAGGPMGMPPPGSEGSPTMPPMGPSVMPPPGGTAPASGVPMGPGGVPMGSSPMSMDSMGGANRPMDPADFRYVGTDYLPLRADKVRSAMKSEKPEDAYYVVAKRMPVRMRLLVDQRKLNRFLSACGNCPLPVEIRQVRINRKGETASPGMDIGGGAGYGMPSYGGESPMSTMPGMPEPGMGPGAMPGFEGSSGPPMGVAPTMGPGMMGPNAGDMTTRKFVSSASEYDVSVELHGIIYIYNPVDKTRLGIQDTGAVATGPATGPAAAAPAGTNPARG
jgi:hypothetical protein